jgi:predicted metal-dependent phosphoesterase TrpH
MSFADLHLHSEFSDGTEGPAPVVLAAKQIGLTAIALCDHDTTAGLDLARECGKRAGLEVIPGIELTAEYNGREIHLLGYFIDYRDQVLEKKLRLLQENRIQRIYKILEKLQAQGVSLAPERVFAIAKGSTVGRLHIAQALLKEKLVTTLNEAFQRFIGDQCPAYVCGFRMTPQEAISLINASGGIPVLAHPSSLNHDELIPQLVKQGLRGLEVYYPEHTPAMIKFYLGLAKRFNLLTTGGSDYHGQAKPEVKIGAIKIPYALVEKLKAARFQDK